MKLFDDSVVFEVPTAEEFYTKFGMKTKFLCSRRHELPHVIKSVTLEPNFKGKLPEYRIRCKISYKVNLELFAPLCHFLFCERPSNDVCQTSKKEPDLRRNQNTLLTLSASPGSRHLSSSCSPSWRCPCSSAGSCWTSLRLHCRRLLPAQHKTVQVSGSSSRRSEEGGSDVRVRVRSRMLSTTSSSSRGVKRG